MAIDRNVTRRIFNGVQLRVTVPRHFAQALGIWSTGAVRWSVDEQGRLILEPFPREEPRHDAHQNQLGLDRPAVESAQG